MTTAMLQVKSQQVRYREHHAFMMRALALLLIVLDLSNAAVPCTVVNATLPSVSDTIDPSCSSIALVNVTVPPNISLNISIAALAIANPSTSIVNVTLSALTLKAGAAVVVDGFVDASSATASTSPNISIMIHSISSANGALVFHGVFPTRTSVLVSDAKMTADNATIASKMAIWDTYFPTYGKIVMLLDVTLSGYSSIAFQRCSFVVNASADIFPMYLIGAINVSNHSTMSLTNVTASATNQHALVLYKGQAAFTQLSNWLFNGCVFTSVSLNGLYADHASVSIASQSLWSLVSCTLTTSAGAYASFYFLNTPLSVGSQSVWTFSACSFITQGTNGFALSFSALTVSDGSSWTLSACVMSAPLGDAMFISNGGVTFSNQSSFTVASCTLTSKAYGFHMFGAPFSIGSRSSWTFTTTSFLSSVNSALLISSSAFSITTQSTWVLNNCTFSSVGSAFYIKGTTATISSQSSWTLNSCVISATSGNAFFMSGSNVVLTITSGWALKSSTVTCSSTPYLSAIAFQTSPISMENQSYWILTNNAINTASSQSPPISFDVSSYVWIGNACSALWTANSMSSSGNSTCVQWAGALGIASSGNMSYLRNTCTSTGSMWYNVSGQPVFVSSGGGPLYQGCNRLNGTMTTGGGLPGTAVAFFGCALSFSQSVSLPRSESSSSSWPRSVSQTDISSHSFLRKVSGTATASPQPKRATHSGSETDSGSVLRTESRSDTHKPARSVTVSVPRSRILTVSPPRCSETGRSSAGVSQTVSRSLTTSNDGRGTVTASPPSTSATPSGSAPRTASRSHTHTTARSVKRTPPRSRSATVSLPAPSATRMRTRSLTLSQAPRHPTHSSSTSWTKSAHTHKPSFTLTQRGSWSAAPRSRSRSSWSSTKGSLTSNVTSSVAYPITQTAPSATDSLASLSATIRVEGDVLPRAPQISFEAAIASTAAAGVGAVSSGAASLEAPMMAMIGAVSCGSPSAKKASSSSSPLMHVLSPFATLGLFAMLFGNIGIASAFACSSWAVTRCFAAKRGIDFGDAAVLVRFPSLPIKIALLTLNGITFSGFSLLQDGQFEGTAAVVYMTALIGLVEVLRRRTASKIYFAKITHQNRMGRLLLPRGAWQPEVLRKRFGVLFSSVAPDCQHLALHPFVYGVCFALVSSFDTSVEYCYLQYSLLALMALGLAAFVAWFSPYRGAVTNLLTVTSSLSISCSLWCTVAILRNPRAAAAETASDVFSTCTTVVLMLKAAYSIVVWIAERDVKCSEDDIACSGGSTVSAEAVTLASLFVGEVSDSDESRDMALRRWEDVDDITISRRRERALVGDDDTKVQPAERLISELQRQQLLRCLIAASSPAAPLDDRLGFLIQAASCQRRGALP